jgi:hypothetical protein
MGINRWAWWDRMMRAAHLYTGLLLVPWMAVYAVSAFCLNHYKWFSDPARGTGPKWELEREVDFPIDDQFPEDPNQRARAILNHLDLAGAYQIAGDPASDPMVIFRRCATGQYQVAWHRQPSRLVVQRYGAGSLYQLVNNLHFQHRYDYEGAAYRTWAVIVDVVTFSTILWIVSGIYLWARRPSKRRLGGACLVAGAVLFAWLVVALCQ